MYIHTVSVQFHINMQNMDVICIQGITPQIKLRIPIVSMKEFRTFSVYGKMVALFHHKMLTNSSRVLGNLHPLGNAYTEHPIKYPATE